MFAQNIGAGGVLPAGDEVDLPWEPEHTFALDGAGDANAGVERDEGASRSAGRLTGSPSERRRERGRPSGGPTSGDRRRPAEDRPARRPPPRDAVPPAAARAGLAGRCSSSCRSVALLATSLQTRPPGAEIGVYEQTFRLANYTDALTRVPPQFVRSFLYAVHGHRARAGHRLPAGLRDRVQGRPVANLLLVRSSRRSSPASSCGRIAWKQILADEGRWSSVAARPARARRRRTAAHQLARPRSSSALTYNFLPFMVLPIYASSSGSTRGWSRRPGTCTPAPVAVPQGDVAAVDARRGRRHAADVHPGGRRLRQRRAAGQPEHAMIGNVIDSRFFRVVDYPTAAALSFVADGRDPAAGRRSTSGAPARRSWYERARRGTARPTAGRAPPAPQGRPVAGSQLDPDLRGARRSRTCSCRSPTRSCSRSTTPAGPTSSGSGFTLDNWQNPCGAPEVCRALGNSLKIGLLATVVATVLGTMVAFALARHRFRGRPRPTC